MHTDGKLSFRRRVPIVDDPDLPLILGGENPPDLDEIVPARFEHVEIEVGPGKGAFLLAAAEARPDTFMLGIEAASAYAKHSAERLKKAGRDNSVLLVDNAKVYLKEQCGDASLDRLHVYFPDPWPKRRHAKHRFVQPHTVDLLCRLLRPGGGISLRTDAPAYAYQMLAVLNAAELLVNEAGPRHFAETPREPFQTPYEIKFREQGLPIYYLEYRKRQVADDA